MNSCVTYNDLFTNNVKYKEVGKYFKEDVDKVDMYFDEVREDKGLCEFDESPLYHDIECLSDDLGIDLWEQTLSELVDTLYER